MKLITFLISIFIFPVSLYSQEDATAIACDASNIYTVVDHKPELKTPTMDLGLQLKFNKYMRQLLHGKRVPAEKKKVNRRITLLMVVNCKGESKFSIFPKLKENLVKDGLSEAYIESLVETLNYLNLKWYKPQKDGQSVDYKLFLDVTPEDGKVDIRETFASTGLKLE